MVADLLWRYSFFTHMLSQRRDMTMENSNHSKFEDAYISYQKWWLSIAMLVFVFGGCIHPCAPNTFEKKVSIYLDLQNPCAPSHALSEGFSVGEGIRENQ